MYIQCVSIIAHHSDQITQMQCSQTAVSACCSSKLTVDRKQNRYRTRRIKQDLAQRIK